MWTKLALPEICINKSSASLHACLQDNNVLCAVLMYRLCITVNYLKMTITTINM